MIATKKVPRKLYGATRKFLGNSLVAQNARKELAALSQVD
jgi:hypothetical protein